VFFTQKKSTRLLIDGEGDREYVHTEKVKKQRSKTACASTSSPISPRMLCTSKLKTTGNKI
jgi:hypothetical protein